MAYTLQAVIGSEAHFAGVVPAGLRTVMLGCGGAMVPLDAAALKAYGLPFCPLTDGEGELPSSLLSLCRELSAKGPAAYVEAEFFGGAGTQACALFAPGEIGSVTISPSAINGALKWLGVTAGEAFDEFEAVGLGKHRETESWR